MNLLDFCVVQVLAHIRKAAQKTSPRPELPKEAAQLKELAILIKELLLSDRYIARSAWQDRLGAYLETVNYYKVLQDSGMLDAYCHKHRLPEAKLRNILRRYTQMEPLIERHNEKWMSSALQKEEDYLDGILKDISPEIRLDEDQRRVVLSDEDYSLVIAGAGAGKTTTMAAKVKYLVERQRVAPEQILVVSFTNKAVQELKEKINRDLKLPCPVCTFHSVGNAILRKESPEEKKNIADDSRLYFVVRDYFRGTVLKNQRTMDQLILFFATYFDAPYEGKDLNAFFSSIARSNYSTLRSELEDFHIEVTDRRSRKTVTIRNEVLRSRQETEIANFLYLNRIDYTYEPEYPYHIPGSEKPYTPDFLIRQGNLETWFEHFGISEDGKNDRYSPEELTRYKAAVNDKIRLHRRHGTPLLYTFSSYKDGRSLQEHLAEQLTAAGFVLSPRSSREVMEKLVAGEENRYIRKLTALICRFISNFKVNGFTSVDFDRMYYSTQNVRARLFLDICSDCYLEYQHWLSEHDAVDFQDMINESARILREAGESHIPLDFRYIIVDEYQDISRQRFDLTKALSDATGAKIIAVGDDWQSIYAFSGADISLFTQFEKKMGYAKLLKIVRTYRNSQEVIDIAGNFIQRNSSQIRKSLLSEKHLKDPVIIYTYDASPRRRGDPSGTGPNYAMASAVERAIRQILEFSHSNPDDPDAKSDGPGSILLLGRYGFDGDLLERSGLFEYIRRGNKLKSFRYPEADITFMTVHSSKGLGYDNVIVVNGKNETYGFPSKIRDDPVLSFVLRGDRSMDYAEERRLFYVAMTRTKNRVFFIAPEQNPSEFLLELKRDYKNVSLRGSWNETPPQDFGGKPCPVCGYPLQLKYKPSLGLRLYICTNEPEICGFMTNDYRAGKLSILKCSCCRDGYMIVKPGRNKNYFLGCTNYRKDGRGCNHVIWKEQFCRMMGYAPEENSPRPTEKPAGS